MNKPLSTEAKAELGITRFDAAEYLDSDELIALYLAEILKDGTDAEFIQALNTVARAKGMNELAKIARNGEQADNFLPSTHTQGQNFRSNTRARTL